MAAKLLALTAVLACASGQDLPGCPEPCVCAGLSVDCSHRGLRAVPGQLPEDARRLDLEGNNLTVIGKEDFRGMHKLRILQLMDNQIHTIHRGAFADLSAMERLRLNNNQLRSLPDSLFQAMASLQRLDLSHNRLAVLGQKLFSSTPLLKNLQVDNNELTCIDDAAIRGLKHMEILTLNRNNLTTLAKGLLEGMDKLRVVRLSENPLACDCRLAWLTIWLRRNPRLGLFTRCGSPPTLKGKPTAELQEVELSCSSGRPSPGCTRVESACPFPCSCYDGVLDCRDKALTVIPSHIPDAATDL